jgi:hypothetical protein
VKVYLIAITGLILALCSNVRAADPIVIVVDSWWSVEFAKMRCGKKCNDPLYDPAEDVTHFENELMTRLASNPLCSGVEIRRYAGPKAPAPSDKETEIMNSGRRWTLMLDFMPGVVKQFWGMAGPHTAAQRRNEFRQTEGRGDAREIAESICPTISGRGAKILN